MTAYHLTFDNQSPMDWVMAVYQHDPDTGNPNVMSLAWFTKKTYMRATVTFTWNIDYCFAWSQTGILRPGSKFIASQIVPADLGAGNRIGFDCDPSSGGACHFLLPPTRGGDDGTLYIDCANRVSANEASVGIGMSGRAVYAVQAQPNITAMFTSHPKYYVAFGQFQQGEVLDITQIAAQSAKVDFPANVYRMMATLDSRNNWSVNPV